MDLRNVVFAIALSFAVLFGWSVIFETPYRGMMQLNL